MRFCAALFALPAALASLPVVTFAQTPTVATPRSPEIVVTGTGPVMVKPDTAYLSLGVVTRGKQIPVISSLNGAKTAAVIKRSGRAGSPTTIFAPNSLKSAPTPPT